MQYFLALAAVAGLAAAAGPLEARTTCSISGVGSGTCKDTGSGCSGGKFYAGSGPPWPCPGGNNIQCCIVSQPTCSISGVGSGVCKDTGSGCSGGAFHAGSGPPWPCPGGDNIQCCIKSAPSNTCSISGVGSGVCQSTSTTCSGGSYHAGSGPPWPCPGGDDIQCCIKGSGGGGGSGGNLPGLNSAQSSHANAIMGETKTENLGRQGCLAAITTGLTESSLLVYANNGVPSSLNYPHDAVGSDHDSIGIFQQRASIYTNIAADMDPAKSAAQFFQRMKGISGWQTMDVGTLCQKVQVSAYPDRYNDHLGAAQSICSAGGF